MQAPTIVAYAKLAAVKIGGAFFTPLKFKGGSDWVFILDWKIAPFGSNTIGDHGNQYWAVTEDGASDPVSQTHCISTGGQTGRQYIRAVLSGLNRDLCLDKWGCPLDSCLFAWAVLPLKVHARMYFILWVSRMRKTYLWKGSPVSGHLPSPMDKVRTSEEWRRQVQGRGCVPEGLPEAQGTQSGQGCTWPGGWVVSPLWGGMQRQLVGAF